MNISALNNIDSSVLNLSLFNNPRLSECAIAPICSGITTPDSYIYIAWNATGCDSTEEVLYNCESVTSQVTGLVYIDMNCDSIYDNGDFVISGHLLNNVSDAFPFAASSTGGHFQRFLTPQSSYSFAPDSLSGYSFFPDAHSLVTTNAILNYSGRDFSFCPDSSFHNVQVTLTDVWHPIPGFTTQYQVCVNNTGTYYENVTFTVDFSTTGASDFIYNLEAAGGIVNGNSITFNTGLSPFTPLCFTINMTLSSGTPLGLDLVAHAEVQIIDGFPETSQSDNTADLTSLIVGSFDPNDKAVYPQEIDYDAIDDEIYLEYLIRFQNTGTFPATFVEILDTLDSKLDIRSIEMISASHPYTLSFPDQQILKWRFDNINLPDSSSNEPESHGFIRFKIKALPGLTPSDIVSNKAYIIFDYNTPVVTNTASTSVIVSLPEIKAANRFQIYAYPNPANDNIILSFNLPESNEIGILISDTKGAILKQFNIAKQSSGEYNYKIDLSDLVPGTYFIKVISKNNVGLVKVVKLK